jgi:MFS family permease
MGILSAFLQLGMAIGPPALGAIYDAQGSYSTGFLIASGATLAAAFMLMPVKPRYWHAPAVSNPDIDPPATSRIPA